MIEFDLEAERALSAQENRLKELAADVRYLTRQTEQNIVLIGQRLMEIKKLVGHGDFKNYISENCGYSYQLANRFMKIASEYTTDTIPMGVGIGKLTELLALPAAEREEFMQTHDVENTTVRELRAEIAKRKAEAQALTQQLQDTIQQAQSKVSMSEYAALDWQRKAEGLEKPLDEVLADKQDQANRAPIPTVDDVINHPLYKAEVQNRKASETVAGQAVRELEAEQAKNAELTAEVLRLGNENVRLQEAALTPAVVQDDGCSLNEVLCTISRIQNELNDLREAIVDEAAGLDCMPKWSAWLKEAKSQLLQVATIASGTWMNLISGMPIGNDT